MPKISKRISKKFISPQIVEKKVTFFQKLLAIKFPIKDLKKGKINGLLGVLVDISDDLSEREDLEKDIVILNEATKLASLAEMSSGVAHEINNPLTIIAGVAQIMDMKLENNNANLQELRELTKTVQKATERSYL